MFGDLKKVAADAKIAIETFTLLNDRLEKLVERLEVAMAPKENI